VKSLDREKQGVMVAVNRGSSTFANDMTANNRIPALTRSIVRNRVINTFFLRQTRFSFPILSRVTKRLFDIAFSATVLTLGFPIYLLLAVFTYISSPGPVFFSHQRVGRNGRSFGCMKFRTMVPNADQKLKDLLDSSPELRQEFEETFKLKNDPRVTWIGKFLRVTSLDELPQFINVLKGEMSVVGPRPLVKDELVRYGESIHRVLSVKPGITGLWQVSGRNDISYEARVKLDISYVTRRSFVMDLSLIVRTVSVMILPKNNGAY
jgi:lipopolysaccharide/colanic/teichoic acid biosynthesis glycosyltransferase